MAASWIEACAHGSISNGSVRPLTAHSTLLSTRSALKCSPEVDLRSPAANRKRPDAKGSNDRTKKKKDDKKLTLAAWELKPPMLPAMAEPTRFFAMLHSTIWSTVVLRTDDTVFAARIASTWFLCAFIFRCFFQIHPRKEK